MCTRMCSKVFKITSEIVRANRSFSAFFVSFELIFSYKKIKLMLKCINEEDKSYLKIF